MNRPCDARLKSAAPVKPTCNTVQRTGASGQDTLGELLRSAEHSSPLLASFIVACSARVVGQVSL